jgi:hypothetical protein
MLIYHSTESSYCEGIYTSEDIGGGGKGIYPASLTVTVSWCVAAASAVVLLEAKRKLTEQPVVDRTECKQRDQHTEHR